MRTSKGSQWRERDNRVMELQAILDQLLWSDVMQMIRPVNSELHQSGLEKATDSRYTQAYEHMTSEESNSRTL